MKRYVWWVLLLLILSYTATGCYAQDKPVYPDSEQTQGETDVSGKANEFSVFSGSEIFSLFDWDNEIQLSKILGDSVSEDVRELGSGADTFMGSFVKELKYDGLELSLFSPKGNGEHFWIYKIAITDSTYTVARGIKTGDSVDIIKKAYPDIEIVKDGRTDANNCAYRFTGEDGFTFIYFEVEDGLTKEIKLYHEFP